MDQEYNMDCKSTKEYFHNFRVISECLEIYYPKLNRFYKSF